MIIVALVAGILGLLLSLALRRNTDRAKSMRTSGGILDDRFVFMMIPGFSLLLLCSGLLGLIIPGVGGALGLFGYLLATLCGVGALFGVYLAFLGLGSGPVPNWALPKWLRRD